MLDAVIRTLWRLFVSGKHMLEWVTAADAEDIRENSGLPGRVAAILMIPGLFRNGLSAAAVALAALFLAGPGWIRDMERDAGEAENVLSPTNISMLTGLARDTWRFFEKYVPLNGKGLPPDNVQTDPPVGPAARTSPTNIGLYLVSCVAARRMGFIRDEEMRTRLADTVGSMEAMEKWSGHLCNWYDIQTLAPLKNRFVSSVDSGNLAACLLLAAAALENMEEAGAFRRDIARRLRGLAVRMDFRKLYDEKRGLFLIGVDGETDAPSAAHYDLLASESRILSYTAMMLGQVDTKHWTKLSRTAVSTPQGCALASWSGTMFEYLMPEIFMPSPAHSLLGRSCRTVVKAQKALAEARKRPWGISESGYHAFDMHRNYQYRAFGIRSLALGECGNGDVIAPYASVLALSVDAAAAAENVRRMKNLGWAGEMGFFEAADYTRERETGEPDVVRSHMAHHQGMILCALCNALCGNYLSEVFMSVPEARALELLIQEKPVSGVKLGMTGAQDVFRTSRAEGRTLPRTVQRERRVVEASAFISRKNTVQPEKN
ncbi:MAG: hypothetical protein IKM02_04430 [Clostridia bacterium]|nr:hypothetical protein [Clostridia bacterium]